MDRRIMKVTLDLMIITMALTLFSCAHEKAAVKDTHPPPSHKKVI